MPDRKKILIASVLKPVDDVRHFRKMARALALANKYQIFIIGKGKSKNSGDPSILFLPTGNFSRFSLRRIYAQFLLFKTALEIRPHLLLITTPELIPLSFILKNILNLIVVYDIQEHYLKNITHQVEYSPVQKALFLLTHRVLKPAERAVDYYFLAERIYEKELMDAGKAFTTLENKIARQDVHEKPPRPFARDSRFSVIISGTLSPYTNPITGIAFFKKLHEIYPNSTLTLIGKVFSRQYKAALMHACRDLDIIELKLDFTEVPYTDILEEIHHADMAIIAYQPDEVNQHKIPTKLFEYAANKLPYFVQKGTYWESIGKELGGAIGVDFSSPDLKTIQQLLENPEALFPEIRKISPFWEDQEEAFINVINSLLYTR